MERRLMVTAPEIVADLGVSRAFAYNLIKRLNDELEAKGYITIAGKVSRMYYEEKIYGMQQNNMRGAQECQLTKKKITKPGMCLSDMRIGQAVKHERSSEDFQSNVKHLNGKENSFSKKMQVLI